MKNALKNTSLFLGVISCFVAWSVSPAHAEVTRVKHKIKKEKNLYHDTRHYYDHSYPHETVIFLPAGAMSIELDGYSYYYKDGSFYKRDKRFGYIKVPVPYGRVMNRLPPRHRRVKVDGENYYVCDGLYFVTLSGGYKIVPNPEFPGQARQHNHVQSDRPFKEVYIDGKRYYHVQGKYDDVYMIRKPDGGYHIVSYPYGY